MLKTSVQNVERRRLASHRIFAFDLSPFVFDSHQPNKLFHSVRVYIDALSVSGIEDGRCDSPLILFTHDEWSEVMKWTSDIGSERRNQATG